MKPIKIGLVIAALATITRADAAVITAQFTQTSSDGTHNDFPGVRAVVADASNEDHRGITEFAISALSPFSTAVLAFDVLVRAGNTGLSIQLVSFMGDGVYSQSGDFSATPTSLIATFTSGSLTNGETLTYDVTSQLNAAILAGNTHLGFRLQRNNDPMGNGARVEFNDFTLTTTELSQVPEPSSLALLGIGVGALGYRRRRSKESGT